MKKFQWRLQKVLEIKKKQEQAKRVELFKNTEKLAETRSELIMQKKIMENISENIKKQNPEKRLSQQELFLKNAETNNRKIKRLTQKEKKLRQIQAQKTQEVMKLRSLKEALEKLKEKAKEKSKMQQEKLEQKASDHQAAIKFVRNKMVS